MTCLPRIAQIQRAVAEHHNIPVETMREPSPHSKSRSDPVNGWNVSRPRQEAMALSWLLTDHSGPRIGHFFGGRDHTTVIHACRAVDKRRKSDPKLDADMKRLSLELIGVRS